MTEGQGKSQADNASIPREHDHVAREAAFRRAQKHSRKVRYLKLALPVAAIFMAATFVGYSYLSVPGAFSFDISESAYADGKLVMANPKLDGYTKDSRPYSMTATRALQHVDRSGIVELEGIDAKVPVSRDVFATIGAERGVYDRDKNTLDIPSQITVKTTDGMTAVLQSAYLEIANGNLKTSDPVDIKLKGGQLAADAMTVFENGKVLIFEKRVKMEVTPNRLNASDGPTEESTKNVQY